MAHKINGTPIFIRTKINTGPSISFLIFQKIHILTKRVRLPECNVQGLNFSRMGIRGDSDRTTISNRRVGTLLNVDLKV